MYTSSPIKDRDCLYVYFYALIQPNVSVQNYGLGVLGQLELEILICQALDGVFHKFKKCCPAAHVLGYRLTNSSFGLLSCVPWAGWAPVLTLL